MNAAEKAAQYASRSHELEERVRVLEQIVTDSGAQTAAQIEALRNRQADQARAGSQRQRRGLIPPFGITTFHQRNSKGTIPT